MSPNVIAFVEKLEAIILDVRQGKIVEALDLGRQVLGALVDLIPVDALRASLTERDRTFVDLRVDVAESTKLDAAADVAEVEKLAGK